jgi:hypothetical protein
MTRLWNPTAWVRSQPPSRSVMHVMPVIFLVISDTLDELDRPMGALAMHAGDLSVVCSSDRFGGLAVCVGVPLADVYLEFLGGRRWLT